MKKVVVTGANGFIGRHLIDKLVKNQCIVCAIVRPGAVNLNYIEKENVTIIECSLENIRNLPQLVGEEWDAFYHLAWQGVSNLEAQDLKVQLDNVQYACDAVKAAAQMKAKKFIFASSIMEYEIIELMDTELKAGLQNVYSTAKMTATYMTRILSDNNNISYCAAIISNVYGPYEYSNRFVVRTLKNMIWNRPMEFSAGTQMYDFIYIDDACDILFWIGEKGQDNKRYYVGSSEIIPLKEYIYRMKNVVNENYELHMGRGEYVGVSVDYGQMKKYDVNELKRIVFTSFEEGVLKTAKWIREEKVI